jgi:hypothetical protein
MKSTVHVLILYFAVIGSSQAVVVPYFEDFESEPLCATTCTSACILSTSGWTNQSSLDDQDWLVDSGGTTSGQTGPDADHTLGTSEGRYLYIETSSPCSTILGVSNLISPPIDLTGTSNPRLEFFYHMFGDDVGNLHIDVLDFGQSLLVVDLIPPITENINQWQSAVLDLTEFISQTIFVRFRSVHSGTGFLGDMAIDDVSVYEEVVDDIFRDGFE